MEKTAAKISLAEIFLVFARIGLTGFGGGMAVVALIERVCVKQKRWINNEEFMHGVAFGQMLGPFSLNICTFTGHYLRGIAGGFSAAVGFILPSFLLVSLLSWLYFTYNTLPQLQAALKGTNPVVIGLILVVAIDMGRKQVRSWGKAAMALTAFAAAVLLKLNGAVILLAAALLSVAFALFRRVKP
jgi:chromate transporter